jgi:glycosyltransferase involved in cell wall biosynthesis
MDDNHNRRFSVIIPMYNEEENISFLHEELVAVLRGYEYELIYVNDGSSDLTYAKLKEETSKLSAPQTKIINLPNNLGQSLALKNGLDNAEYPIIVFMDGDFQIDPRDIPRLVAKINEGFDFVQGIREKRKDLFFSKIVPAITANFILWSVCGSKFKDIGCSLKAFRKELIADIVFQRGIHRILPLYLMLGGAKFTQIKVNHRKRVLGKSKYGMSRIFEFVIQVIRIIKYKYKTHRLRAC